MTDLHRELWNAGFSIWETGGGCQAYGLTLPSGRYLLVTDLDGGTIDIDDGNWTLGAYTDGGDQIEILDGNGAAALAAALADMQSRHGSLTP